MSDIFTIIGGGLDVVFCIWWLFVVYDSPSEHPRITEKERLYIQQCMESKQDKHVGLHASSLHNHHVNNNEKRINN